MSADSPSRPPPPASFYDECDNANDPKKTYWPVERIRTGLQIGKVEYNDILTAIEVELGAERILGEALMPNTGRVHQPAIQRIMKRIEFHFWSIFSRAPEPWRGQCLWRLVHKVNNNFRERRNRKKHGHGNPDIDIYEYPQEWSMNTGNPAYLSSDTPAFNTTDQWSMALNGTPELSVGGFASSCETYAAAQPDPSTTLEVQACLQLCQQQVSQTSYAPPRYTKFIGVERDDERARAAGYNVVFIPVADEVPVGPQWTFPDWIQSRSNIQRVDSPHFFFPSFGQFPQESGPVS